MHSTPTAHNTQNAVSPKPARHPRWVVPAIVAALVIAVVFILLRMVGISIGGGPSSNDGMQVGPVSFGGTRMGNTEPNYINDAPSVSDDKYDYFYLEKKSGICRAAKDGSGADVIRPISSDHDHIIDYFSLDGDTLIYRDIQCGNSTDGNALSIHAMKTDGTGDREIWKAEDADNVVPTGVYVYDSKIYMLTYTSNGSIGSSTGSSYEVLTMDEDGSNQSVAGTFSGDDITRKFITPSKAYLFQSVGSSDDYEMVGAQNFDGSGRQTLYTAADGAKVQRLYGVGGKLYIDVWNRAADTMQVACMNEDGSDASTVYASSADDDGMDLYAVSHGSLYLFGYSLGTFELIAVKAPLDGSSATKLPGTLPSGNTTINEAGDHLLILSNDYTGGAVSAYTIDFDGNKLQDYAASNS